MPALNAVADRNRHRLRLGIQVNKLMEIVDAQTTVRYNIRNAVLSRLLHELIKPDRPLLNKRNVDFVATLQLSRNGHSQYHVSTGPDLQKQVALLRDSGSLRVDGYDFCALLSRRLDDLCKMQV